ncbi:MAG: hypothetical protein KAJ19_26860, partial [Gammaproteobacteria bacterium]|nr:hypothetical protein [Gammaproteobacteria bacterium]
DNMFTNCFSQSAASWSDFMSAVNIQVTELQTGVKIDAEAQHTVAGGNAISNIAALKTWAITDRGPIPP